MHSDTIFVHTPHVAPTLDTIAPEIRQVIFQHLFRGNTIRVRLRGQPGLNRLTTLADVVRGITIVCDWELETPKILLANKKFNDEELALFYEKSTFSFEVSQMHDPWNKGWSKERLLEWIDMGTLRNIRNIELEKVADRKIAEMIDVLPGLKYVCVPEVRVGVDLVSLRGLDDSELVKKIFAIDDIKIITRLYQDLAIMYPEVKISGIVVGVTRSNTYVVKPLDTYRVHVDFSAGVILNRNNREEDWGSKHGTCS